MTRSKSAQLLDRDRAVLVVIDMQEGFRPAAIDFDEVSGNVGRLIEGCHALGVPILVTEQYPRGLGETVPEIKEKLEGEQPLEKVCFSAADADGFLEALVETGRDQVLLSGIESHVCVSQTAHDLLDRGLAVQVADDAVSSRSEHNRERGLRKMEAAGAVVTSTEAALFELLGRAGTPEFKAVQKLVM